MEIKVLGMLRIRFEFSKVQNAGSCDSLPMQPQPTNILQWNYISPRSVSCESRRDVLEPAGEGSSNRAAQASSISSWDGLVGTGPTPAPSSQSDSSSSSSSSSRPSSVPGAGLRAGGANVNLSNSFLIKYSS